MGGLIGSVQRKPIYWLQRTIWSVIKILVIFLKLNARASHSRVHTVNYIRKQRGSFNVTTVIRVIVVMRMVYLYIKIGRDSSTKWLNKTSVKLCVIN